MVELVNQESAFRKVMDWARLKYGCWFQRMEYNKGRHVFLRPMKFDAPSFYVVFKREFFMSFEHVFPELLESHPYLAGVGESINEDSLMLAIRLKATYLCFVHPDGVVWVIHPMIFLNFARKHELKRIQVRTNFYKKRDGTSDLQSKQETTLSIPKALLTKLEAI